METVATDVARIEPATIVSTIATLLAMLHTPEDVMAAMASAASRLESLTTLHPGEVPPSRGNAEDARALATIDQAYGDLHAGRPVELLDPDPAVARALMHGLPIGGPHG